MGVNAPNINGPSDPDLSFIDGLHDKDTRAKGDRPTRKVPLKPVIAGGALLGVVALGGVAAAVLGNDSSPQNPDGPSKPTVASAAQISALCKKFEAIPDASKGDQGELTRTSQKIRALIDPSFPTSVTDPLRLTAAAYDVTVVRLTSIPVSQPGVNMSRTFASENYANALRNCQAIAA
jgi:hypothetical protein